MGLEQSLIRTLIALRRSGNLGDQAHIVEIGAQQLSNSFLRNRRLLTALYTVFERTQIDLGDLIDAGRSEGIEHMSAEMPYSRVFWESLGFSHAAIEYNGHGDSPPFDLNRDEISDPMRGCADLVVNGGTTEHVMNQDNAFRAIHDLTKHGGVMFHLLPGAGMLTHGLFEYTPKFFWHLCRENEYEVLHLATQFGRSAPISNDVLASNDRYNLIGTRRSRPMFGTAEHCRGRDLQNVYITAVLKKVRDVPYVTPLDIP
jgi:hypothetical protein